MPKTKKSIRVTAIRVVPSPNRSRPSKGWRELSPRLTSQRRQLLATCGPHCFLDPEHLKFPICDKSMDCQIHCAGLDAASVRAGQFKYKQVLRKSKKMYNRLCKRRVSSRRVSSRRRRVSKSARK